MFKSMLFNASSRRTAAECLAELCLLVFRFWKMADTFTGLKLQGMLGRFGKTPLTDIDGYVELPDGKVCFLTLCLCTHTHTLHLWHTLSSYFFLHQVISGSEWGNMLLWDGDLIKVELRRKDGCNCHAGPIHQFALDEGELITVGADGAVRVSRPNRGCWFCLRLAQTWLWGNIRGKSLFVWGFFWYKYSYIQMHLSTQVFKSNVNNTVNKMSVIDLGLWNHRYSRLYGWQRPVWDQAHERVDRRPQCEPFLHGQEQHPTIQYLVCTGLHALNCHFKLNLSTNNPLLSSVTALKLFCCFKVFVI